MSKLKLETLHILKKLSKWTAGRTKVGHLLLSEQTKNITLTQQSSGCCEVAVQTFLIHTAATPIFIVLLELFRAVQGCSGHIIFLFISFNES